MNATSPNPQEDVMTSDRIEALETLLVQTEAAHGEYETTELNGVYDEAWPTWYAEYAIDHGIGALLARPVTFGELAQFLGASWDEAQRADPPPTESWSASMARRLATEL